MMFRNHGTTGSTLPKDAILLQGERPTYEVFMLHRLHLAIKKKFPTKYGHVLELGKRLEAVRHPQYTTDMDIEFIQHFCGDAVVVRDQLGPLVTDQIQLLSFISDKLNRVLVVNAFTNWSRISQDEIDVCAVQYAKYESQVLSGLRRTT